MGQSYFSHCKLMMVSSVNKPLHGSNCTWLCRRLKQYNSKIARTKSYVRERNVRRVFTSVPRNIGFCTRSKAMQSIGNYFLYALTFDMVMRSWHREGANCNFYLMTQHWFQMGKKILKSKLERCQKMNKMLGKKLKPFCTSFLAKQIVVQW